MKLPNPACLVCLLAFGLVTLPATAQNSPPSISPIANRTVDEDMLTGPIPFTVQDAETPVSNLILTGLSSNPTLVPAVNILLGGSGANRTITLLPAANQAGTTVITVTARDPEGGAGSMSFILTVVAVNDPPTLDPIPDLAFDVDAGPRTISLSGISSGAPNESQILSVSATSSDPAIVSTPIITYTSPGSTGSLTLTALPDTSGTATITVSISDGVSVVSRSFKVTISPALGHGLLALSAANYVVDEDVGLATVQVVRTGGSAGMVSVQYRTLSGTATPELDYAAVNGVLTFAAGQTNGTFRIPIVNDALVEGDETVLLVLTNATGGAALPSGSGATSTLTISTSDGPAIAAPSIGAPQRQGDQMRFQFTGEPGYDYFVEVSDSLASTATWQILTNFNAKLVAIEAVVTDSLTGPGRFYRIRKQDCLCD